LDGLLKSHPSERCSPRQSFERVDCANQLERKTHVRPKML
jgi:hypothetical protein